MSILTNVFKSSAKVQTAMGFGLTILGIITMFFPFISSMLLTQLLAITVAGGAIATMIYAFKMNATKQKVLHFISGIIALVAAVFIYQTPILSMYSITAVAICYLIVDGLFTLYSGVQQRKQKGAGWIFFNALCSLLLAWLLIADWPVSGLYAVSMFVGVKLIVNGWSYVMLGFAQHGITEAVEEVEKREKKIV